MPGGRFLGRDIRERKCSIWVHGYQLIKAFMGSGPSAGTRLNKKAQLVELSAQEAQQRIDELAECLVDAVDSGASVSFLPPLPMADARVFWERVIQSVHDGATILIGALLNDQLVGTVQLRLDTPQNQQHRGRSSNFWSTEKREVKALAAD